MSFFGELISGGAEGLLKGIGSFAKDIRTAITGEAPLDSNKRAELLIQAQAIEAAQEKALLDFQVKMSEAQTAINAVEANNPSIFVSGWRPAIGWICGFGLFYAFLLKPLLPWLIISIGLLFGFTVALPLLPAIPMSDLLTLLFGMLGLGAYRSYEKVKGVASTTLKSPKK